MSASTARAWPVRVRLARADDKDAVLAFATNTWDGWDYIPEVWDTWMGASDGVLLVGTAGVDDRPICFARLAMLSADEAWLEGIRVDPAVRGLGVATDFQVAELLWAAAHGARVIRYATGQDNEGSHRLGAHGGLELIGAWRTYGRHHDEADEEPSDEDPMRPETASMSALLVRAESLGVRVADGSAAVRWWERLERDPEFVDLGRRLYEYRVWAFQELTRERFTAHLQRGEIFAREDPDRGGWALAIVDIVESRAEDSFHVALLTGDPGAPLHLLQLLGGRHRAPRIRLPDPDPPVLRGALEGFVDAGYTPRDDTLHLLGRPIDSEHPVPPVDPERLILVDEPRLIAVAPGITPGG